MALTNEHKIYVALAVLAGVGGGVWYVQQQDKKEQLRYVAGASSGSLPELKLPADDVERITKLEIKNADKPEVVIEKDGDKWRVKKPVDYPANQANVKSLLDNLKELKAKDVIDKGTGSYAEYNLEGDKAVHVVAYKGGDKAVDLWFGKAGGRGQMTRKGGIDGVYAVSGYSSYVYARDVKNWRDTSLLKFDDAAVTRIDLKNENGEFVFKKEGDAWSGTLKGEKAEKADKLERFDENKVKDMLRAYKALNADDFADDKSDADTGLDKPSANLTITLKEGDPIKLAVGKTSSGESRYLKKEGTPQAFIISSWSAGWATAKADKFQKPEEKKDGGADDKKDEKKKDDKKKDDKKKDDKKLVPSAEPPGSSDLLSRPPLHPGGVGALSCLVRPLLLLLLLPLPLPLPRRGALPPRVDHQQGPAELACQPRGDAPDLDRAVRAAAPVAGDQDQIDVALCGEVLEHAGGAGAGRDQLDLAVGPELVGDALRVRGELLVAVVAIGNHRDDQLTARPEDHAGERQGGLGGPRAVEAEQDAPEQRVAVLRGRVAAEQQERHGHEPEQLPERRAICGCHDEIGADLGDGRVDVQHALDEARGLERRDLVEQLREPLAVAAQVRVVAHEAQVRGRMEAGGNADGREHADLALDRAIDHDQDALRPDGRGCRGDRPLLGEHAPQPLGDGLGGAEASAHDRERREDGGDEQRVRPRPLGEALVEDQHRGSRRERSGHAPERQLGPLPRRPLREDGPELPLDRGPARQRQQDEDASGVEREVGLLARAEGEQAGDHEADLRDHRATGDVEAVSLPDGSRDVMAVAQAEREVLYRLGAGGGR
jgi:hypothetical protein